MLIFNGCFVDFRQELVFIGCEMKEELLRRHLDSCLLTDEELSQGPGSWERYEDPFPIVEHDHDHIDMN